MPKLKKKQFKWFFCCHCMSMPPWRSPGFAHQAWVKLATATEDNEDPKERQSCYLSDMEVVSVLQGPKRTRPPGCLKFVKQTKVATPNILFQTKASSGIGGWRFFRFQNHRCLIIPVSPRKQDRTENQGRKRFIYVLFLISCWRPSLQNAICLL